MLKLSGLVKKIGNALGEHFLGIETCRFYKTQGELCKKQINNIEVYNNIKRDLRRKNFEAIFFGKLALTSLNLLGLFTIASISNTFTYDDGFRALFGLSTIITSELSRWYVTKDIREDKKRTESEVKTYISLYNKNP